MSGVALIVSVATIIADYKSKKLRVKAARTTKEGTTAYAKLSDGLRGSFPLNEQTINEEVDYGSPGVYALGYKEGETFIIEHIGRSDTNVNAQLKKHIGRYDRFKFDTSELPSYAFIKECEVYHALGGPGGRIPHPDPGGMAWSCPKCSTFDSQVSSIKPQSGVTTTGKRFCVECGMELPTDDRFCTRCGQFNQ